MRFESDAEMLQAADSLEAAAQKTAGLPDADYQRRARVAAIVAMLRNRGERSYELPPPLPVSDGSAI
jgi:hypothetical protein